MNKFLICLFIAYSSSIFAQTKLNVFQAKNFAPLCIPALSSDSDTSTTGYCIGIADASLIGAYSMLSALMLKNENPLNNERKDCLKLAYEKIKPDWPEILPLRFIETPDAYEDKYSSTALAFKLSVKEFDNYCL